MRKQQNLFEEYNSYIKLINRFEKEIMFALQEDIEHVGVSVQLYYEVQDEYSPTREHTDAVNCYCRERQRLTKESCNLFDKQAKEYYLNNILYGEPNYTEKIKPLLCCCYADVTNLLFLFNPNESEGLEKYRYNNRGVNIFIFIGHFLLEEYPTIEDVKNSKIDFYDKSDGRNLDLINTFKPIKTIHNTKFDNTQKLTTINACENFIQTATYSKLQDVKVKIQTELTKRLINNGYLNIDEINKVIKVKESLVNINDIVSLDNLRSLLDSVNQHIHRLSSVSINRKRQFEEIKQDLSKRIKQVTIMIYQLQPSQRKLSNKKIDDEFNEKGLYFAYKWLKDGLAGEIGLESWYERYHKNMK